MSAIAGFTRCPFQSAAVLRRPLCLERLERRLLLSRTDPIGVDADEGYIDLGGKLRFQLLSGSWDDDVGVYTTADPVAIGLVPEGSAPFIPMIRATGGIGVRDNAGDFYFCPPDGKETTVDYVPAGKEPAYDHTLFVFEFAMTSEYFKADDLVDSGCTVSSGQLDLGKTTGLAVPSTGGSIAPSWFQLTWEDSEPVLNLQGTIGFEIFSKFGGGKVSQLLHGLNIDLGSNDNYMVAADKFQKVTFTDGGGGGGWVSVSADPFKLGGFTATPQNLQFSWQDGAYSFVADVVLAWGAGSEGMPEGTSNTLYLELGTRDLPGLTIKDGELVNLLATITHSSSAVGDGEASSLHAGGSAFSLTQGTLSYDHFDESFGIAASCQWSLGADHFTVACGTQENPGLVIRDGEIFSFDVLANLGSINMKSLAVELEDMRFSYERYAYEGEDGAAWVMPEALPGDVTVGGIANQYYHPEGDVSTISLDVSGLSAGQTIVATSSDREFLEDDAIILTQVDGQWTLTVDADPTEEGNQAPEDTGKATITLSTSDGDALTHFDFTVGTTQIAASGTAMLQLGNGPAVGIGASEEAPWKWIQQTDGSYDWDMGSLRIMIDGDFGLGPLKIQAEELAITYIHEQNGSDEWTVSGGARFPALWNAEVVFGDQGHPGLVISDGKWDVNDVRVSLSGAHFGAFGLENLVVHYSTDADDTVDLDVQGALGFPGGFSVGAGFSLKDNQIDMIEISYEKTEGEGIPLGDTGLFIVGMSAEVDNIYEGDLTVRGGVVIAGGPSFSIRGKEVAFITVDGDFWVNRHGMEISADATMLGSKYFGSGTAYLLLDWGANDYRADISVSILDGFVEFEAWAEFQPGHEFMVGGKADLQIPDVIPVIGGKELAEVGFLLKATPDDSFVAGWLHIWLLGWVGAEYDFDSHHFSLIGHGTIKKLKSEVPDQHKQFNLSHDFAVTDSADGASFATSWDHPEDSVEVRFRAVGWGDFVNIESDWTDEAGQLVSDPTGNSSQKYRVWAIPQLSSPTSMVFVVHPDGWSEETPDTQMAAGKYSVSVNSDTEVWPDISGQLIQPSPTLSLTLQPDPQTPNTANVLCTWQSASPDATTIDLYYDDDKLGYDGKKFATVKLQDPGTGYFEPGTYTYAWTPAELAELPPEPVYVYGIINDGTNVPIYSTAYSQDSITPQPPLVAEVNVPHGTAADWKGWTVKVLDQQGEIAKDAAGFPCVGQTNAEGRVGFNLPPDTYTVLMTQMTPLYRAQVGAGQEAEYNGGITQVVTIPDDAAGSVETSFSFSRLAEITGRVFYDANANGAYDPDDYPLSNWDMYLDDLDTGASGDSAHTMTTETDETGAYHFYVEPPVAGQTAAFQIGQLPLPANFEDVQPAEGTYLVSLWTPPDETSPASYDNDFLDVEVTTVTGVVFADANANGRQDEGEAGLPDVTVTLTDANGNALTGTTDALGAYWIQTTLPAGGAEFKVAVTAPSGAAITRPADALVDFGAWTTTVSSGLSILAQDPARALLAPGDLNRDGHTDLLVVEQLGDGTGDVMAGYIWDDDNQLFKLDLTTTAHVWTQAIVADIFPVYSMAIVAMTDDGGFDVYEYWTGGDETGFHLFGHYTPVDTSANAGGAVADLDGDPNHTLDVITNDGYGWTSANGDSGPSSRTSERMMPPLTDPAANTPVFVETANFRVGGPLDSVAMAYQNTDGEIVVSSYAGSSRALSYSHVEDIVVPGVTLLGFAADDLDGDGDTDLVVATQEDTELGSVITITILETDRGGMRVNQTIEVYGPETLSSLTTADLDGDRRPDIFWASPGEIDVLMNQGEMYFISQKATDYAPENTPEMEGDCPTAVWDSERQCLIVVYATPAQSGGHVAIASVPVTAQSGDDYDVQISSVGLHAGFDFGLSGVTPPQTSVVSGVVFQDLDENGERNIDEPPLAGVSVELRDTSGTVVSTATTDAFGCYEFDNVAAGDYQVGLAASNLTVFTPHVSNVVFGAGVVQNEFIDLVAATLGDFTGDGLADFIGITPQHAIVQPGGSGGVNPSPGQRILSAVTLNGVDGNDPRVCIETGDLDGDGDLDVVLALAASSDAGGGSQLVTLLNDGSGSFTTGQAASAASLNLPAGMGLIRTADLDDNGASDVVWFGQASDPTAYTLWAAGDGTFGANATSARTPLQTASGQWDPAQIPDLGDINGDGIPDLVISDPIGNAQEQMPQLVFFRGYGAYGFRPEGSFTLFNKPGGFYDLDANGDGSILLADVTCDGLNDIIVATDEGSIVTLFNYGAFLFSQGSGLLEEAPGFDNSQLLSVQAVDLNEDGYVDLATAYRDANSDGTFTAKVGWYVNNGHGGLGWNGPTTVAIPDAQVIFRAGDMDGDRALDLALTYVASGAPGQYGKPVLWPNESWEQYSYVITCDGTTPVGGCGFAVRGPGANQSSIAGSVFQDHDSNGKWDKTEPGISDVKVFIDFNGNTQLDAGEPYCMTDALGNYSLKGLNPGKYWVQQVLPGGYTPTTQVAETTTTAGQTTYGVRFGDHPEFPVDSPPVAGFGGALSFDGQDDYVSMTGVLDDVPEWSLLAWVKPTAAATGETYCIYSEGNAQEGIKFYTDDQLALHIDIWNRAADAWVNVVTPGGYFSLDTWTFLSAQVRYDTQHAHTDLTIWFQGEELFHEVQTVSYLGDQSAAIGANVSATLNDPLALMPFAGVIDEVSVWTRPLSDEEVAAYRQTTLTGHEGGLSGYWHFDDQGGTLAADATDQSPKNNGTVHGGAQWVATGAPAVLYLEEDGTLTSALFGEDPDGDALAGFALVSAGHNGEFSLNELSGAFTYTPAADWNGNDTLSYYVSDGGSWSREPYEITLYVASVNDPPVASDDWFSVSPGATITLDVLANDSDYHNGAPNENNVPLIVNNYAYASLNGQLEMDILRRFFTYTAPDQGHDVFWYYAEDSLGGVSGQAYVTIMVNPQISLEAGERCKFVDADGSRVTVRVSKGTTTLWFGGEDFHYERKGNTITVTGTGLTLDDVDLSEATFRSSLSVNVSGGDGRATIRSIHGSSVRRIDAPRCDLIGDGLDFAGDIYSLSLHGISGSSAQVQGSVGTTKIDVLNNALLGIGQDLRRQLRVREVADTRISLGGSLGKGVFGVLARTQVEIVGNVLSHIDVRDLFSASAIGIGVSPGPDGVFFTGDDEDLGGQSVLSRVKIHHYEAEATGGILTDIVGGGRAVTVGTYRNGLYERVALRTVDLPYADGEFRVRLV